MEGWSKTKIKDITSVITKGTTPTTLGFPFADSGVNFIKAESVTVDGRIDQSKFAFIDEGAHDALRRSKLQSEDILFSMAGMVIGKTALVPPAILPANTNQALGIIRLKKETAYPPFVDYCLRKKFQAKYYDGRVAQSAQPNFNLADIGNLEILLPPIEEQKAIAKILSAFDDKIELNRRMNATLEAMARALFKAWFVDFEPVHANHENRPSTSASPEIAKLFPSTLENNIPKGWRFKPLGEIADVNWGDTSVTKKSYVLEGFSAYSASGSDGFLPYFDFERPGIVVSAIGANSGLTWLARGKWSAIKNTITIFSANERVSTEYLYLATIGKENWTLRGSAQPFLSQTDTRAKKILFPANSISKEFGRVCEKLYERIESNDSENVGLAEIRDSLVPRLICGKIQVNR